MWAIISEFPDYEVSDEGQVRSNRKRTDGRGSGANGRVMVGFVDGRGYHRVMLRKPGCTHPYSRTVHRLVALAFIPNPALLPEVAHRDGKASNNHKENLRWSTHKDNQMDMLAHGTVQHGERSITSKITHAEAEEIHRRAHIRGEGRKLAKEFGLSPAQISRIKNGKRWSHLATPASEPRS